MRTYNQNLYAPVTPNISKYTLERYAVLLVLITIDFAMILLASWLAYMLRFELGLSWAYSPDILPLGFYRTFSFELVWFWLLLFWIFGLYDFRRLFSGIEEYTRAFNAITLGMMVIILYVFFVEENIARGWIALMWLFITASVLLGRFTLRRVVHYLRSREHLLRGVLIIGANEEGQAIAQQLQTNRNAGIWVAAFVDDTIEAGKEPVPGIPVLGSTHYVDAMVNYLGIHEIIIASTALSRERLIHLFQTFGTADDIVVRLSSGLYELLTTGVEVQEVGNVPLMTLNKTRLTGFDVFIKRLLDLFGSVITILFLLPFMLLIGIAIKLDSHGPVIHKRRVVGEGGKLFDAWKFRTMYTDADQRLARDPALRRQFEQNYKLIDDPRVTEVGKWLRRTSLDELPQLFNVLAGQMSLVGPRMITEAELARYGKLQLNLSTVKPGITGLWQVSGRSDIDYEERVVLDMRYIRNYSIWFDIYLLWRTVPAVLKGRGAY